MTDRDGEDQAFVDAISEWPDIDDGPTLAGFLLARIAEDEADARRAASFKYDAPSDAPWERARAKMLTSYEPHQARWSPARALAECEAKRRIVAMHEISGEAEEAWHVDASGKEVYGPTGHVVFGCSRCDQAQGNDENWYTDRRSRIPGCTTLRVLALPYADHPDYRPEWRT